MASNKTRLTYSMKVFDDTLQKLFLVTKRTAADELNKQLLQVVIGAKGSNGLVQLTQKATTERIIADMEHPVKGKPRVFWLALNWLKSRGQQRPTNQAIADAAIAITKARVKSRAFIAASWLHSAAKLARFVPDAKLDRMGSDRVPMYHGGHAANTAKAIPAHSNQGIFRAAVYNTAGSHPNNVKKGTSAGAEKVAGAGLRRALNNAAKDMAKKIHMEIGKKWAQVTAGKR